MATWVIAAINVVVGICAIAAQFYFRWVPDVEVQKRHIKNVASWASDILSLVAQAAALYFLVVHISGPVTPMAALEIAAFASITVFCVVLTVIRRWILALFERHLGNFGRLLDNTDQSLKNTSRHINLTGGHIAITAQHRDALRVIAKDPSLSIETTTALQALVGGDEPPDVPPRPLLTATAGKKARKSPR